MELDRTHLREWINRTCDRMTFKNAAQRNEFAIKLEETFLKYRHLLEQIGEKENNLYMNKRSTK